MMVREWNGSKSLSLSFRSDVVTNVPSEDVERIEAFK